MDEALAKWSERPEKWTNYTAFGSPLPGRTFNSNSYRYGMNTQEKMDEVATGHYTAEYWEYDSRIGRRWNLDPKPIVGISDYACFQNNPDLLKDILGDKVKPDGEEVKKDIKALRDIDPAFDRQYRAWKRQYRGRNNNLIIHADPNKANGRPLSTATVTPTPQGKVGSDQLNYDGSLSRIEVTVQYYENKRVKFEGTNGDESFKKDLFTNIPSGQFSTWEIENTRTINDDPNIPFTKNSIYLTNKNSILTTAHADVSRPVYEPNIKETITGMHANSDNSGYTILMSVSALSLKYKETQTILRNGSSLNYQYTQNFQLAPDQTVRPIRRPWQP